jgi:hypothetical protein
MNKNAIKTIFIENTNSGKILKKSQPPKNKIIKRPDIKKMLEYSPKKKAANKIPEYSILYPATNSASASPKSKGVLLVSANIEIKNIIASGNKGKQNQTVAC